MAEPKNAGGVIVKFLIFVAVCTIIAAIAAIGGTMHLT